MAISKPKSSKSIGMIGSQFEKMIQARMAAFQAETKKRADEKAEMWAKLQAGLGIAQMTKQYRDAYLADKITETININGNPIKIYSKDRSKEEGLVDSVKNWKPGKFLGKAKDFVWEPGLVMNEELKTILKEQKKEISVNELESIGRELKQKGYSDTDIENLFGEHTKGLSWKDNALDVSNLTISPKGSKDDPFNIYKKETKEEYETELAKLEAEAENYLDSGMSKESYDKLVKERREDTEWLELEQEKVDKRKELIEKALEGPFEPTEKLEEEIEYYNSYNRDLANLELQAKKNKAISERDAYFKEQLGGIEEDKEWMEYAESRKEQRDLAKESKELEKEYDESILEVLNPPKKPDMPLADDDEFEDKNISIKETSFDTIPEFEKPISKAEATVRDRASSFPKSLYGDVIEKDAALMQANAMSKDNVLSNMPDEMFDAINIKDIVKSIPKKSKGGKLKGPSHKEGGIPANVGDQPLELEGEEYIIKKTATKAMEKNHPGALAYINKTGKLPKKMENGGKVEEDENNDPNFIEKSLGSTKKIGDTALGVMSDYETVEQEGGAKAVGAGLGLASTALDVTGIDSLSSLTGGMSSAIKGTDALSEGTMDEIQTAQTGAGIVSGASQVGQVVGEKVGSKLLEEGGKKVASTVAKKITPGLSVASGVKDLTSSDTTNYQKAAAGMDVAAEGLSIGAAANAYNPAGWVMGAAATALKIGSVLTNVVGASNTPTKRKATPTIKF